MKIKPKKITNTSRFCFLVICSLRSFFNGQKTTWHVAKQKRNIIPFRFSIFVSILSLFLSILLFNSCGNNEKNEIQDSLPKPHVYYLKVIEDFGAVSASYSGYLKRNLDEVNEDPWARAVIIEIDTPGGTLGDALKIAKYIKNTQTKTITFINDSAYSAGAIISLAADYTVMVEGSKVGAAYPVMAGPQGQTTSIEDPKVYAKTLSALEALVEGLADKRKKRLIREISTGKYPHLKRNLNSIRNMGTILTAMIEPDVKLTIEEHGYALNEGDLLTLTSEDAFRIGVADEIHNDIDSLLKSFGLVDFELIELKAQTLDRVFSILTNPAIMSLLITLGTLGMIIELWTAGWGVSGTIGVLSLSLFFIGQLAGANPDWTSLILFGVGIVLVGLELFVIPGFGIVGVAGVLATLGSFVLALKNTSYGGIGVSLYEALVWVLLSLVLIIVLTIILFRFLPRNRSFSKISLSEGKIKGTSLNVQDYENLLSQKGTALTDLRPSGIALISDKRYDVLSDGSYISKGTPIQVLRLEEGKIIVNAL